MFVKEMTAMSFENYFPLWNDLNTAQKKLISDNLITQVVKDVYKRQLRTNSLSEVFWSEYILLPDDLHNRCV